MSILAILRRALFNILEKSAKKSRSGFVCSWWDLRFWGFGVGVRRKMNGGGDGKK